MHAGAILHVTRQLAAGRIDIVAARLAHGGHDAGIAEQLGESADTAAAGERNRPDGETG